MGGSGEKEVWPMRDLVRGGYRIWGGEGEGAE